MAGNTKEERNNCISFFPDLKTDSRFRVTSDPNPFYNCIGFAIGFTNVWVAPYDDRVIPWFWWPSSVPSDNAPESLVATFKYFGFEVCNNDLLEKEFDKVALYSKKGKWTHAARIIGDGLYHSKLGGYYDIYHRSGDVMDKAVNPNESYGTPFVFMRRRITDRYIVEAKRPHPGIIRYEGKEYYYMTPSS